MQRPVALLVLLEAGSAEGVALCRQVDPETAMSAYGAGTLNGEAEGVGGLGGWGKVDVVVVARNVGGTLVGEREEVERLGAFEARRRHDSEGVAGRDGFPSIILKLMIGCKKNDAMYELSD